MEKGVIAEKKRAEQLKMDAMMERERLTQQARADEVERKRYNERMEGRRLLETQMEERRQAKAQAYQDFLREKDEIDKIVEGVRQEEQRKLEKHMKRREEIKQEIRNYLDERREWRRKEALRVANELRKIMEYQKMQEKRRVEIEAQKAQ
eukprot:581524-Amorphochlora_amoeboformis.AAC.1